MSPEASTTTAALRGGPDIDELRGAIRGWLGSGPIDSPNGAYCAWVDEPTGVQAFEYPEITGYALTYLVGREDLSPQEFERALRAADWLANRFKRGNRAARDGWDNDSSYTFDIGMIAAGLISFGRRCESEGHLSYGTILASALRDQVMSEEGLLAIEPGSGSTDRNGWSTEGKPHLLKVVQSLLLAERSGVKGAEEAAAKLVAEVSAMQRPDGAFPTQPGDPKVMLHPHIYTLEGLWMWGMATGDELALDRARSGAEWAWDQQLQGGALPRFADGDEQAPPQGDVTSQAIRIAAALEFKPAGMGAAIERLTEFARPAPGGAALVYQVGSDIRHHNAWVSMFGGQALDWASEGPGGWATLV